MNPYKVITASAGSGKTYSLVKNLLKICFKSNQPAIIRSVLALTFTNKAANEMKERILTWLKEFVSHEHNNNPRLQEIQKELKQENCDLSLDELQQRSQKLLDYILHHYSTLNISTIDKFNTRLVRAFALELGLPQNFLLEVDTAPFILQAVDKTLDKIGEDPRISEAFLDYVNYYLDEQNRIKLQETLFKDAKKFNEDLHYFILQENKDFDWNAYFEEEKKLRRDVKDLQEQAKKAATLCSL